MQTGFLLCRPLFRGIVDRHQRHINKYIIHFVNCVKTYVHKTHTQREREKMWLFFVLRFVDYARVRCSTDYMQINKCKFYTIACACA